MNDFNLIKEIVHKLINNNPSQETTSTWNRVVTKDNF